MCEDLTVAVEDDVVGHEVEAELGEEGLLPHAAVADTAPCQGVAMLETAAAVALTSVDADA